MFQHRRKGAKMPKVPKQLPMFLPHDHGASCGICVQSELDNVPHANVDSSDVPSTSTGTGTEDVSVQSTVDSDVPSTSTKANTNEFLKKPKAQKELFAGKEVKGVEDREMSPCADYGLCYERFTEKAMAQLLSCAVCKKIPRPEPECSPCGHMFCKLCSEQWLQVASACPICREPLLSNELHKPKGNVKYLYESLTLNCHNECGYTGGIGSVLNHETQCISTRKVRGKGKSKQPLKQADFEHVRNKRLKHCFEQVDNVVDNFCDQNYEEKTDVMYCMLANHLHSVGDQATGQVLSMWKSGDVAESKMTPQECLSLRVEILQSKSQYKTQYDILNKKFGSKKNPFQPPTALDRVERTFLPGTTRYSIEGSVYSGSYYHTPAKPHQSEEKNTSSFQSTEPIHLMADFNPGVPEVYTPNVEGHRWCYADALAKTLEELNEEIDQNICSFSEMLPK